MTNALNFAQVSEPTGDDDNDDDDDDDPPCRIHWPLSTEEMAHGKNGENWAGA